MTTPPAVAGFVTTYASHTPYLTTEEWLAAPTAIDITDLIQDGSRAQQNQAVQDSIERASSWVDRICHQVLAATRDTHRGTYLVNQWGAVRIPLPRKPVLEVSSIRVGSRPSNLTALSSLADVDISQHGVITVPVQAVALPYASSGFGTRPIVEVIYVNGYPNSTLAADVTANASSITVASSLGIYPGTELTIYDVTAGTEHVVVAGGFVAGSPTVPLVAPLTCDHLAKVSISNLPPVVKEASILLTSALIQTRGDDAIVLESMDEPTKKQAAYGANADAERLAAVLLADLVRVR